MTKVFREGALTFTFDGACDVGKYDEWSFYRKSFQNAAGGSRGVDFVCVGEGISWLIEATDYSEHPDEMPKPSELGDEAAKKVRDTLAGLAVAATGAEDANEKEIARLALDPSRRWRVALHLEQPELRSRLRPTAINPADVVQKLRAKLAFVDPDACVVNTRRPCSGMNWTSRRT